MPRYRISVEYSGVVLADYTAASADQALLAMVKDCGFSSYRDMCRQRNPYNLNREIDKQRSRLIVKEFD